MTTASAEASPDGARISELDLLRGIAIGGVVLRHVAWQLMTPQAIAAPGGGIIAATCMVADVGVTMFLALSAFGLAWRYPAPFRDADAWIDFLVSRAARLLPAYVLWSLVSLVARDPSLLAAPRDVAMTLLTGTADVQFYYVPMVFELYLLWPVIRPFAIVRGMAGAALVLAGGMAVSELAWHAIVPSPWTPLLYLGTAVATGFVAAWLAGASPRERPFAAVARDTMTDDTAAPMRMAGAVVLLAVTAAALAVCVVRFLAVAPTASSRGQLDMMMMLSPAPQAIVNGALILALTLVAGRLAATRVGGWLGALGRTSYGVYLVHLLVASSFVYRLFDRNVPAAGGVAGTALRMATMWMLIVAASHALAWTLARIPFAGWTVGVGGRRRAAAP